MSKLMPLRLLLLGAPGSGKGTQTSRLLKQFSEIQSISSGDLLRKQIADGTDFGLQASRYIESGELVPDKLITGVVCEELGSRGWLNKRATWLLDGFPRTVGQATVLDKALADYEASLNMVVRLDVPHDVILERIENRYVHVPSGRVYNLQYNPPKVAGKDDVTGEPLSKRPDDTAAVFGKRLEQYELTLGPLMEHYSSIGIMHTVSGETSDVIFPKLVDLIQKRFAK